MSQQRPRAYLRSAPGSVGVRHGATGEIADETAGEIARLEAEVAQLRQALTSRACIDQAMGALMMRYGIDADHAFDVLVRWSSTSNTKLRTVAEALIGVVGRGENPYSPTTGGLDIPDHPVEQPH